MLRFGILTTHPIQYYAPWFRRLAQDLDLTVYYAHRQDPDGQAKAGFGVGFDWDIPLLDGYHYEWLDNVAKQPGLSTFSSCDTPEVRKHIQSRMFDAFLITGWNKKCYWQAFRACKRCQIPILCRGDSQLITPRAWLHRTLKYAPYRWILPQFDVHLFVGKRNRDYLRYYGVRHSQLVFCPHFVDNAFFQERATLARQTGEAARIRAELGIANDAFVLLYVGKFVAKKCVSDIVKATMRVLNQGHVMHLVLVGDGPLRSELVHLSQPWRSNIHFVGFKNQSVLPKYYASSSALVLASNGEETWGLVVNEAMASGLPVIVSDAVGCTPDLVNDSLSGLTFHQGNVGELAERIRLLISLCENNLPTIENSIRSRIAAYSMEHATYALNETLHSFTSVQHRT